MANTISLLLIEDNRLLLAGLTALINAEPDLRVVAAAADTGQGLQAALGANPDVVLLDLGLRDGDSLRVVEAVKRDCPGAKVVAMDLLPAQEDIVEYVRAGVAGFVLKNATFEEFAKTIRTVAAGERVLPASLTGSLFTQIARQSVAAGGRAMLDGVRLTPRERQVIELIGEGLSNKEISQRLHIAVHTVKSHVHNILEKLTLHTRLQIAAYAHGEGGRGSRPDR